MNKVSEHTVVEKRPDKLAASLEQAIQQMGLQDGMTISFHHHFREGDQVLNQVMAVIAKMGFHDLKLAPSSLTDVHAPLLEHIKNGVVTHMESSGCRGKLAEAISHGLLSEPVVFRSHGGRAAAIADGRLPIDIAFLGASVADVYGNAAGVLRNQSEGVDICGSLGYAKVDAHYAKKTVILTNYLVAAPLAAPSIPSSEVDCVVLLDSIGDSAKISSGATRFSQNPRDLLIAERAAQVIIASGYFQDGFSLQTGSGGAALAVTRFLKEAMLEQGVKARFALGGITAQMVHLQEEGLIGQLFDVQDFDLEAAQSLGSNANHFEIDGNQYANPFDAGSLIHQLDVVILSALEVDTAFNVNVLTGSDGIIRGAIGGHSDTAAGAALTVLVTPLLRGRIPCVVQQVNTICTEGKNCDVLVTDRGVAVNPLRADLQKTLQAAGIRLTTIEQLKDLAEQIAGKPDALPFTERVVALVTAPDGTVIDRVHQMNEHA